MQLQIDIISNIIGMKLFQHQDILWELSRKCQMPKRKSDNNHIDGF